jgi:TonB family protein
MTAPSRFRRYILIGSLLTLALTAFCKSQDSPATSVPATEKPLEAASITPGRLIKKTDPKYPKEAKKRKLQGPVTVQATIEENGVISSIAIVDGDLTLADEAVDALRKWHFDPYTQDGRPVKVAQKLTFSFDPQKKFGQLYPELPPPEPATVPKKKTADHVYSVGRGLAPRRPFSHPILPTMKKQERPSTKALVFSA